MTPIDADKNKLGANCLRVRTPAELGGVQYKKALLLIFIRVIPRDPF